MQTALCTQACILAYVNMPAVFPKPFLISPEAVDFLAHELFINGRKSLARAEKMLCF
jgi:hypothetical protein